FFSSRRRHTRFSRDWSSDVCSSDLERQLAVLRELDKLDKRGAEAVRGTLLGEGFELPANAVDKLMVFSQVRSSGHDDALSKLERSEERRVGKECRCRGATAWYRKRS